MFDSFRVCLLIYFIAVYFFVKDPLWSLQLETQYTCSWWFAKNVKQILLNDKLYKNKGMLKVLKQILEINYPIIVGTVTTHFHVKWAFPLNWHMFSINQYFDQEITSYQTTRLHCQTYFARNCFVLPRIVNCQYCHIDKLYSQDHIWIQKTKSWYASTIDYKQKNIQVVSEMKTKLKWSNYLKYFFILYNFDFDF